ncbi:MAG: uroporphyrinogen decarboxylase family protein [Candidatus Merdivicinus sp.]|jgi:uroporphyrinogen decarboxylase
MTRRENFENVMHHKTPEKLILDLGGNPLSTMEGKSEEILLNYLGFDHVSQKDRLLFGQTPQLDERILKYFDIDTRSVGGILTPEDSHFRWISENEYVDEWGIQRKYTGLYWEAVNAPLKEATLEDVKAYAFPDPESISESVIEEYAKRAKDLYEHTDYIICGEHPVYGVFELGCWMFGFDEFLYRIIAEPEIVDIFFQRVLEYQKRVIERYYSQLGPYLHYTSSGDDFATQNGPFISPAMFREKVKPYLKERITYTRQYTQAYYLHHSCGSINLLLDDLIDSGVDIINPIQPKAKDMNAKYLKETFGNRIVFHGGIDTQELLPFSSPEEVRESVENTIRVMNKEGGYIFAAAHNIQEDVNPQNLTIMFETARNYQNRE